MFSRNQRRSIIEGMLADRNANEIFENLPRQRAVQNNLENAREDSSATFEDPQMCVFCFEKLSDDHDIEKLQSCGHSFCRQCLKTYLTIEINESRTNLKCPRCPWPIQPNDIQRLLRDTPELMQKYEDFMLRRYLVALPDTRWCPAPDCGYAVIASQCADCPKLFCQRPGCGMEFCFFCRKPWSTHDYATCPYVKDVDNKPYTDIQDNVAASVPRIRNIEVFIKNLEIKECPVCKTSVVREQGSCNHMVCIVCSTDFCWLCLQPIDNLHFRGPNDCIYFGKNIVSKKKRFLWQLISFVGAPLIIATGALMAIPITLLYVPMVVRARLSNRYRNTNGFKRVLVTTVGTVASVAMAPIVATITIGLGVPAALVYTYGVIPLSMIVKYREQQRIIKNATKRYNSRKAAIDHIPQSDENDQSISADENNVKNDNGIDNDGKKENPEVTTVV